jgi:Arc/MetJ family transcription regulator
MWQAQPNTPEFPRNLHPAALTTIGLHHDVYSVQMRTTLNLDDARIARAAELTGLREKTALIHAGLDALIARASAQRLADLGGQFPATTPGRRRRPRRPGR